MPVVLPGANAVGVGVGVAVPEANTDSQHERDEARERVLDHLLHTAFAANRMLNTSVRVEAPGTPRAGVSPETLPDMAAATAWLTVELPVLEAAVECLGARSWRLASALTPYFQRRAMFQRWSR